MKIMKAQNDSENKLPGCDAAGQYIGFVYEV